jgi:MORN repeat variant
MTTFKWTTFLAIASLVSCETGNKDIISKWDNGKPKVERVYSDTPNCFIEKHYYENGQLSSETKFIDSIKNGESVAYYNDGKLLGKLSYKNGKVNGEVTEFHKTGSIMFKGNQTDGNLVGTAIYYYDNSKPETELYYKDNKIFLVNYWDSIGIQQVINGDGIKKYRDYLDKDKSGNDTTINVFVVSIYKDSLHNGLWRYYNPENNRVILERHFQDGTMVSETWKW